MREGEADLSAACRPRGRSWTGTPTRSAPAQPLEQDRQRLDGLGPVEVLRARPDDPAAVVREDDVARSQPRRHHVAGPHRAVAERRLEAGAPEDRPEPELARACGHGPRRPAPGRTHELSAGAVVGGHGVAATRELVGHGRTVDPVEQHVVVRVVREAVSLAHDARGQPRVCLHVAADREERGVAARTHAGGRAPPGCSEDRARRRTSAPPTAATSRTRVMPCGSTSWRSAGLSVSRPGPPGCSASSTRARRRARRGSRRPAPRSAGQVAKTSPSGTAPV